MKRTKLRRLLPILLTTLTVIICIFGITATATTSTHSNEIEFVNIVLNNDVDILFWVDISEDDAKKKDTFMTFNDGSPVSYSETMTNGDATYVIYRYNNVLPQDIGKPVTGKLYVDGAMNSISTFSTKDYCQYILKNSKSVTLKTLISDLLFYCAQTQALLGESQENLVTAGIEGLVTSEAPDEMKVLYETEVLDNLAKNETAFIGNSKVSMTNGVELTFAIELPDDAEPSDYFACLTVNGREQEVRVTGVGGRYKAVFNAFHPHELFDQAKVDVYKDNVRVSKSVTFCLASYIDELNDDDAYTAVTNAYYNYAYSAHIYGGSHSLKMPGEVDVECEPNLRYDGYGTVTYSCPLCGEVIDTINVSHIRDFEGSHGNGSVSNKVNGNQLFTITTAL